MIQSTGRGVITGLGAVSPIGIGRAAFLAGLMEGRSGLCRTQKYHGTAITSEVVGEIRDFTEESAKKIYLKDQRKWIKVMCREIQLGAAAANLAIQDAGLDLENYPHERIGVEFGANLMTFSPESFADPVKACTTGEGTFDFQKWGPEGKAKMEPLWLLKYLPNMPACHIAINSDARGPSNSLTLDEASANVTMMEALSVLRRGAADAMIVGTTGNRLTPTKSIQANLWKDLGIDASHPEQSCKPFDAHRNGAVIAEGAGCVIVETEQAAEARGAKVWGTVLGGGMSCVADIEGKADVRTALVNAITAAFRQSGVKPEEIGHISAHGLGTRDGDLAEARAIHDVFGAVASKVPVTSLKGTIGNSGAACGSLELVAALLGLSEGVVWPTGGTTQPDPECDLNLVLGKPLPMTNKLFLKLNYTRCGQASALIVRAA
jgi:3-oxoacyl-[acyl-carrier-protein] synthase II